MDHSHKTAYTELKTMYDELQSYLDSVMLDPEDEPLLLQCEQLGDQIFAYNAAILKNNSVTLAKGQGSLMDLINQVKNAKEALKSAEDKVKVLAQVANAIDKVLAQLAKFL
ncbi:hypothetical protein WD347_004714 [Vibrio parahaemolyticus]|uniref:hypothetical protein n=1 Tax=Vibrio parahaemolyticus TaxID=670 RepID=UPI0004A4FD9F|nr:hypothetical protein [Vibrio parahaemolyticus]EJG0923900.1 hypothetical protein [Vibrio parahaemolyticus O1:K68]EJG0933548.1 hypothetical protein [Vibrio parahaemolyticus O1]EJG0947734.1 hypothetical protein [Vibrio parahaemolyticus O10]EGQ9065228.1 hypothetical protein [Vibrio parahaemolyticus]EGQ9104651.1 hypothetical protein [Vibrio parahaemolyticus]